MSAASASDEKSGAVLIVGANSGMGRALSAYYAERGRDLILAGRDLPEIEKTAMDLSLRHPAKVVAMELDVAAFDTHAAFMERVTTHFSDGMGGIVLCQGYMADQKAAETDFAATLQMIATNYTGSASLLNLAANYLESRRSGFIAAISSVAGDRGRQSNYIYGSTKAALNVFMQGLRQRMAKANVPVVTIKPGFVDTAMTYGLPGMFLVAPPEKVARDIARAIRKGKASIYTPWFWWGIMTIITSIPDRVFKKLKL